MADLYKLSGLMKELFPSDPASDLAALQAVANNPTQEINPTKDYITESAKVNEGSLPIDDKYSVSDFAKLAGVQSTPTKEDSFSTAIAHIDNGDTDKARETMLGIIIALEGQVEA